MEQLEGGEEVRDRVQPQQQPQQCPRCDSINTKFCYYNNYSLSQPRYFCKTCRRYWTQGGTLRNVPVGGGCRKGKRPKTSSSSSSSEISSSSTSLLQQQKMMVQTQPNPSSAAMVPYGGGGGYLASFAAFNQLNNQPPSLSQYPFDQSLMNVGVGGGDLRSSSSNLGLLHGFNAAAAFIGTQRQIRPPPQFYQLAGGGGGMEMVSLYNSEQGLLNIPSSTMVNNNTNAAVTSSTYHDWPQISFIHNASTRPSDDASLWSTINTTSIAGGTSNRTVGGGGSVSGGSSSVVVPNQWPDLQGFHRPPQ